MGTWAVAEAARAHHPHRPPIPTVDLDLDGVAVVVDQEHDGVEAVAGRGEGRRLSAPRPTPSLSRLLSSPHDGRKLLERHLGAPIPDERDDAALAPQCLRDAQRCADRPPDGAVLALKLVGSARGEGELEAVEPRVAEGEAEKEGSGCRAARADPPSLLSLPPLPASLSLPPLPCLHNQRRRNVVDQLLHMLKRDLGLQRRAGWRWHDRARRDKHAPVVDPRRLIRLDLDRQRGHKLVRRHALEEAAPRDDDAVGFHDDGLFLFDEERVAYSGVVVEDGAWRRRGREGVQLAAMGGASARALPSLLPPSTPSSLVVSHPQTRTRPRLPPSPRSRASTPVPSRRP